MTRRDGINTIKQLPNGVLAYKPYKLYDKYFAPGYDGNGLHEE